MDSTSPAWHAERIKYHMRRIELKLDGTANCGVPPGGPYREHLEADLARLRGHLATYEASQRDGSTET